MNTKGLKADKKMRRRPYQCQGDKPNWVGKNPQGWGIFTQIGNPAKG
jgi:hypothetical protein